MKIRLRRNRIFLKLQEKLSKFLNNLTEYREFETGDFSIIIEKIKTSIYLIQLNDYEQELEFLQQN